MDSKHRGFFATERMLGLDKSPIYPRISLENIHQWGASRREWKNLFISVFHVFLSTVKYFACSCRFFFFFFLPLLITPQVWTGNYQEKFSTLSLWPLSRTRTWTDEVMEVVITFFSLIWTVSPWVTNQRGSTMFQLRVYCTSYYYECAA